MKTDILIVGGGLAGLALADRLQNAGHDWLLAEARDRLGGRILSSEVAGARFDLGPAWYWPGQPLMADMVARFGLQAFAQYDRGAFVFQQASGAVETNPGLSPMQGSLRLSGGMGRLIEVLAGQLPQQRIFLHSRLTRMKQTPDGLVATIGGRDVTANRAVLAIPPRVLAKTVVMEPGFSDPALSAMRAIPTWMAGQAKILAVYDQPHWREAGFSGDAMSQRGPLVEIHDASPESGGPYALFGFVGIPPDVRDGMADVLEDLAREQLAALFGDALRTPRALATLDWSKEAETATGLDRDMPSAHPRYGIPPVLSQLWDGRLMLGSTETAPVFGGYLEGALEAAQYTERALATQTERA